MSDTLVIHKANGGKIVIQENWLVLSQKPLNEEQLKGFLEKYDRDQLIRIASLLSVEVYRLREVCIDAGAKP